MKIEHENEFIKKLTRRLSKGGFRFNFKVNFNFNDAFSTHIHPTLNHYMVYEKIYKSATVTVYTDLTYYDVSPYILPLEDEFNIRIYIELQKL